MVKTDGMVGGFKKQSETIDLLDLQLKKVKHKEKYTVFQLSKILKTSLINVRNWIRRVETYGLAYIYRERDEKNRQTVYYVIEKKDV